MTKKLKIEIDLPDNFNVKDFELGFVIDLYFGSGKTKLVRHKRALSGAGDGLLRVVVEE
jgi:hypothetical protein